MIYVFLAVGALALLLIANYGLGVIDSGDTPANTLRGRAAALAIAITFMFGVAILVADR